MGLLDLAPIINEYIRGSDKHKHHVGTDLVHGLGKAKQGVMKANQGAAFVSTHALGGPFRDAYDAAYPGKSKKTSFDDLLTTLLHGAASVEHGIVNAPNALHNAERHIANGIGTGSLAAAKKIRAAKRHGAATAPVDPLDAAIASAMGGPDTSSKAYTQSRQKAINSAILSSRHEYDNAIKEANDGYTDADKVAAAASTAMDPVAAGAQRGFGIQNQDEQARIAAANRAAVGEQTGNNDLVARTLGTDGMVGTGAQQVAHANDAALTQTAANTAAMSGDANRSASASSNMASDMAATSKMQAHEQAAQLVKDRQKTVNDLRSKRAAAIEAAKSGSMKDWEDAQTASSSAANDRLATLLKMKDMQQIASDSAANRALQFQLHQQDLQAKNQPSVSDQIALINLLGGLGSKTSHLTKLGEDKKPYSYYTPSYTPQQLDGVAASLGIQNPFGMQHTPKSGGLDVGSLLSRLFS